MSTPTTDPYLATALALDPKATFEGTRTFTDGTTCPFRARADLYVIQAAWSAGCDFEDLADGYGAGMGTNDDWSGIRDSSAPAVAAMYAKAKQFLISRSTPTAETTTARIARLYEATCDAYSFDAYSERGWRSAIRMLVKHGLTDRQIEAVLRSKWTRWAGDSATNHSKGKRYGRFNGRDLERFINSAKDCGWSDVAALTVGTFGSND